MRRHLLLASLAAAAFAGGACRPVDAPAPVTLAIVNARVWTGDPQKPWAEAIALADDTIRLVGSNAEVRALLDAPPADGSARRVIDAEGGMVTPGFIDSHVHFATGGLALSSVQLRDARTPQEFIRRIAEFAKGSDDTLWIRNGDWDHSLWGGELPTRAWIDSVTGEQPLWINRLDGHMALANSAALRRAGVTAATVNVSGGEIVRDAKGEPTGILKDNAMALVDKVVPALSDAEFDKATAAAMAYVASHGVTAVHDMSDFGSLASYRRHKALGTLKTRILVAVPLAEWAKLRDEVANAGRGDALLRIGLLKGFVDGSLGSHTAAMLSPFTDAPRDSGFFVTPPESLYAWTKGADAAELQVAVHAIGDRAIRTQLDIFERVAKENGAKDRRFRIEHAQHIATPDLRRFGALGVIPSMQPYHAIDDGRWADAVIGAERALGTYAFRALIDAGAPPAFGSDWFVAPPTPLEGIYAAVTRRTLDDKHPEGWVPSQKITVEEALRAYTAGAARAGFMERDLGMLRPGMLGDLVVISRDLTTASPDELRSAFVRFTVLGGKIIYARAQ